MTIQRQVIRQRAFKDNYGGVTIVRFHKISVRFRKFDSPNRMTNIKLPSKETSFELGVQL